MGTIAHRAAFCGSPDELHGISTNSDYASGVRSKDIMTPIAKVDGPANAIRRRLSFSNGGAGAGAAFSQGTCRLFRVNTDFRPALGRTMICKAVALLAMLGLPICMAEAEAVQKRVIGGEPERGRAAIVESGCAACHVIPGIPGPHGHVGPPLTGFARRALIAGTVPNRPAQLVQFIRNAPSFEPTTAMPKMPIDEETARHMAAYLMTLR